MANYYLHRNGENFGPYPDAQIKAMLASNDMTPQDLICIVGGSEWVPASTLQQAQPVAASAPQLLTTPTLKTGNAVQPAGQSPYLKQSPYAAPQSNLTSQKNATPTSRPGGISFVGWLQIIGGILAILMGIFFFFMPNDDPTMSENEHLVMKLVIGGFTIGMGIFTIFIGKKLLAGKNWARILLIIFSIIGCLSINPLSIAALIVLLQDSSKRWCTQ